MIVIIDFGMGNLSSINYKLRQAGFESMISSDAEIISSASKLILPGVGNFKTAMENINSLKLKEILDKQVLVHKKPILGICLGFQLFCEHSAEGDKKGLGWIRGKVRKFSFEKEENRKVPHVGWNTLHLEKQDPIFANVPSKQRFYFTHSYYVECDSLVSISTTNYGISFTSALRRNNIVGTQFHPEKSHKSGFQVVRNFCEINE